MYLKIKRLDTGRAGKMLCFVNGRFIKVDFFCISITLDVGHVVKIFSEHLGYELYSGQIFYDVFTDKFSVTQYGNAVAYFIYLLKEMCYKDNTYALLPEISHEDEKLLYFLLIQ